MNLAFSAEADDLQVVYEYMVKPSMQHAFRVFDINRGFEDAAGEESVGDRGGNPLGLNFEALESTMKKKLISIIRSNYSQDELRHEAKMIRHPVAQKLQRLIFELEDGEKALEMLTDQELKSVYEADDPALRDLNSRKMIAISWETNQVAAETIYKYLSDRDDIKNVGTLMREACIKSFAPRFQRRSYLPCRVGHDFGDRESSKRLAKILWRGDLFRKDILQAREIYAGIITAESDPESEFYYGALSYNSTDIPQLKVNSACWIKRAANKGFDKAIAFYDEIKYAFSKIPDDCIPLAF